MFEIILLNIVLIILKSTTEVIKFPLYPYIFYIFTVLIFNNLYSFMLLDFKLKKNAKEFFKYSLYNAILAAILAVIMVVFLKWGASGRLLAIFITGVVFGVISFKKMRIKFDFDRVLMKESFVFCWPLAVAGALGYFFSGFDRGMLALKENNVEFALYSIALRITNFLAVINVAIGQTFMPDFFKFVSERNYKKLLLMIGVVIGLSVLPVLVFNFSAEFILDILTSGRYIEAAKYAKILSFKNISMTIYSSMSIIIVAFGYSKATLVNKIIGSFASIYLFRYLINKYSFAGAAWGQVLSYVILSLISFIYLLFKYNKKKGRI